MRSPRDRWLRLWHDWRAARRPAWAAVRLACGADCNKEERNLVRMLNDCMTEARYMFTTVRDRRIEKDIAQGCRVSAKSQLESARYILSELKTLRKSLPGRNKFVPQIQEL